MGHGLGKNISDMGKISCPFQDLTLCRYLNPYCLGRKTAFFFSGHLNLHAKPETRIPYREKNYNN
jgi:hypothetical protein